MGTDRKRTWGRALAQAGLGGMLVVAGTSHLTTQRKEFQAQVPSWFPADPDAVVLASGVVEISLGAALLSVWRQPNRSRLGVVAALFFVAVFPGNIAQYTEHRDGFSLDTDTKRLVRLFFQPLLVFWAWRSTRAPRP